MACPTCGAPMVWRGSLARGGYACPGCDPVAGNSEIMKRYSAEVHGWHRPWCAALKRKPTDPKACDCGHAQPSPHTHEQIEQRERAVQ